MTPQQIALVRSSFALVRPIAPTAAAIFYDKLFAADPGLRQLFKGDMTLQGERLMTMIGSAVALLDQVGKVLPVLRQLGARHVAYGVRDQHYVTVGQALVATLQEGLGQAFTAEVREAWIAAYALISRTMQEGAWEASLNVAA
ncbi:globin family protein [Pelomonas sp. KK5]|uniref:globin family protein n=1 Tax=Pelomonas sp. KK5 TaxID=1855730 RepID=UPI00097C5E35|nr:globin family protein [Pelomonas sp. KK5]